MNITIIGLGWLGLPLALKLKQQKHSLSGSIRTSNNVDKINDEGINCFQFDSEKNNTIPSNVLSNTDVLVLTVPPIHKNTPEVYGQRLAEIVKMFSKANQIIFTSSTSVYPNKSGLYAEDFSFLEIEKSSSVYNAERILQEKFGDRLTIVRLAGLMGPNRHPVTKLQGQDRVKNPYGLVNLVHQTDVIRAISLLIENKSLGIYNIVSPEHPYRKEYYTKLYRYYDLKRIGFMETPWIERKISSAKFMAEFNFFYEHSIMDLKNILDDPYGDSKGYFKIPDLD